MEPREPGFGEVKTKARRVIVYAQSLADLCEKGADPALIARLKRKLTTAIDEAVVAAGGPR